MVFIIGIFSKNWRRGIIHVMIDTGTVNEASVHCPMKWRLPLLGEMKHPFIARRGGNYPC